MKPKKPELPENMDGLARIADFIPGSEAKKKNIRAADAAFLFKITPHYASLIDWKNPSDPLMKMIVPDGRELNPAGLEDTSGESASTKINGLQHKYPQTALVLTTDKCFGNCRFCFRKRIVSKKNDEVARDYPEILAYIRKHGEINNVLLTGGDPLTLPTARLMGLVKAVAKIPHVKTIRIGTRSLAYCPERIIGDPELAEEIAKICRRKQIYVICHFDHPREISKESLEAIRILQSVGVVLMNQAVLMKGINDNALVLAELFNRLSEIGIRPYYLFQCRPVKNEIHFQIEIERGIRLFDEAKKYCSGLAKTPRYICSYKDGKIEILGKHQGKTFFKYHQARDVKNVGKVTMADSNPRARWFDDYLK